MLKHTTLGVVIYLLKFQGYGQAPHPSAPPSQGAESDSTFASLAHFTEEYAKIMETWSPEKKKRFADTFLMTRGQIKIPEKPIEWNNENE